MLDKTCFETLNQQNDKTIISFKIKYNLSNNPKSLFA